MTENTDPKITALQAARRERIAQREARLAELISQPFTAEAVAEIAKLVAYATPVVATETAEGTVHLCLKYEGRGDNAVHLLNIVRDTFLRHGHRASLVREVASGQIILTVQAAR